MKDVIIFPTASVIGDVDFGSDCIVFPGASIRAVQNKIVIGKRVNIQDNAIVYQPNDNELVIEDECTLLQNAGVTGDSRIGTRTLIGFGAIVTDCEIGRDCIIAHNATVFRVKIKPERFVMANSVIATQEQADELPKLTQEYKDQLKQLVQNNRNTIEQYKEFGTTEQSSADNESPSLHNKIESALKEIESLKKQIKEQKVPQVKEEFKELYKEVEQENQEHSKHLEELGKHYTELTQIIEKGHNRDWFEDKEYDKIKGLLENIRKTGLLDGVDIAVETLKDKLSDDEVETFDKIQALYMFGSDLQKEIEDVDTFEVGKQILYEYLEDE